MLSNSKLRVYVNGTMSLEFQSFIGAFQGDCLSGCLFTLVLAGALCELRVKLVVEIDWPNPPITELGRTLDTEYADDVDSNDEEKEKKLFCQWRLKFSKILTSSSMKTKQTSPTCTWLSLA